MRRVRQAHQEGGESTPRLPRVPSGRPKPRALRRAVDEIDASVTASETVQRGEPEWGREIAASQPAPSG